MCGSKRANGCASLEGSAIVVRKGGSAEAEVCNDSSAVFVDGRGVGVHARAGCAAAGLERIEASCERDQTLLDLASEPLCLGARAALLKQ